MTIDLQSGKTLCSGRYTIVKKIGEGGFSITYRAIQNDLDRVVCIKEFFPSFRCTRDEMSGNVIPQDNVATAFEKYRQSFRKEAETLATLQHENIVEVMDVFDENNTSYMVMPFVEGQTLQQIVEQQGPLDYPQAVNYLAQVAEAVAYIHERHILHRDIKPENIIITAEYRAILIDFGSAREYVNDMTQSHTSILTHGYAPVEQYATHSRKGSYTDTYALGATLYFVLTGKVPLDAVSRMTEVMTEPQQLNPAIPDEANLTILKAMQMNAADRYQTVQEFMDNLRNIKKSVPPIREKSHNVNYVIYAVIVVLCVAFGVLFGIIQYNKHKAQVLAEQQDWIRRKIEEEEAKARRKAIQDSIARVNFQTPDLKMVGAHGPIKSIVYSKGSDPVLETDVIYFDENGIINKLIPDGKQRKDIAVIKRGYKNILEEWKIYCDNVDSYDDRMKSIEYSFDVDGLVTKKSAHAWESGWNETLSRDENGKIIKIKGDGAAESWVFEYTITYKYLKTDVFGNWTELEYTNTGYEYEYDSSNKGEKKTNKGKITRTIEYYE